MINIVLFLIGILCVIISFFFVVKDTGNEKRFYDDIVKKHKEIIEYTKTIEDIVDNIEYLANSNLYKMYDDKNSIDNKSIEKFINYNRDKTKESSDINFIVSKEEKGENLNIRDEIIRLSKMGLDNNEIAKRLNRGKREVDIILKLKDDKN